MKNLSRLMLLMLLAISYSNVNAQDEKNPWQITLGVNAVDFYPTGLESPKGDAPLGELFSEFFNAGDHYNILPSLSVLSVSRYIKNGISVNLTGSLNKLDKFGDDSLDDFAYYAVDLGGRYNFTEGKTFDPFAGLGIGSTWVDNFGVISVNGTVGFNVWFSDNVGLTIQSAYKHVLPDHYHATTHFQHTAGISIKFGGKDTDGDGIYDKDDACPEVAGLEEFAGCPDTDGDGIQDSKDDCPGVAGLAELNGCPDTDGDGVIDSKDKCPTVAGLKALAGCPDADGDGVTDAEDTCPEEAGPAANKGCPWTDKDSDGVLDKDDKCPEVKGTVANNGCPEVTEAVQKQLNAYAKTILFNSGKSTIKTQSEQVLKDIIAILKEYPSAKFTIEGHTDSIGNAESNKRLSDSRANAVKQYLVQNGIDAFRLSSLGYGEENPIDSNKTKAGRANNRRVEINLAN